MEEYERCCNCGNAYAERHHVIYRSQCKPLENSPIDIILLCPDCHRGNNGPHKNKKVDLKYKREPQSKLEAMFSNGYYTTEEIKDRLQITDTAAQKLIKILTRHKEGYERVSIIQRCLGGRMYE